MALSQFWFGFVAGFSGQMMFFDYLFTLYNALFTAIPIILLAVLDQKYPERTLLEKPWLYPDPLLPSVRQPLQHHCRTTCKYPVRVFFYKGAQCAPIRL